MPLAVIDVLTIAAVTTLLWSPARVALAVLVTAVFLVPAPLLVPHAHSSYLTVLHVLVLAGVGRIVARRLDGRLDPRVLRLTPVHYAGLAFVAAVFAVGVVFVVTPGPLASTGLRLSDLGAQAGFFVVVLALVREMGDLRAAVTVAAGATLASTLVALVEHATGASLGHWLFSRVPGGGVFDAAQPLSLRGGQARVRAGAEFALQYGWLVVTMLPFVVVAALRSLHRRVAVPVALGLCVAAVYWSYTRSALVGVGATLVVMALVARERRATLLALTAIGAGVVAVAVHPQFLTHVSREVDTGSINARFERVAPILEKVAAHPFRGLGLGNLTQSGFATTDNAYLLEYTEVGAVGVAVLALLLLVALAQCARALTVLDDDDRLLAGAAVASVVAYIASAMFYDAFTLLQGALLLWFAVAVGTVTAERSGARVALPRPRPRWVLATAAGGVAVGFAAVGLAPVHVATDGVFTTLPTRTQAGTADPIPTGEVLVGTVCQAAALQDELTDRVRVRCRPEPAASGYGRLRVEAQSTARLRAALTAFTRQARTTLHLSALRLHLAGSPTRGRASVWATAPAWVPIGLLGLLLLVPWRRGERDHAGD